MKVVVAKEASEAPTGHKRWIKFLCRWQITSNNRVCSDRRCHESCWQQRHLQSFRMCHVIASRYRQLGCGVFAKLGLKDWVTCFFTLSVKDASDTVGPTSQHRSKVNRQTITHSARGRACLASLHVSKLRPLSYDSAMIRPNRISTDNHTKTARTATHYKITDINIKTLYFFIVSLKM